MLSEEVPEAPRATTVRARGPAAAAVHRVSDHEEAAEVEVVLVAEGGGVGRGLGSAKKGTGVRI